MDLCSSVDLFLFFGVIFPIMCERTDFGSKSRLGDELSCDCVVSCFLCLLISLFFYSSIIWINLDLGDVGCVYNAGT